jgi:hypothetical protein
VQCRLPPPSPSSADPARAQPHPAPHPLHPPSPTSRPCPPRVPCRHRLPPRIPRAPSRHAAPDPLHPRIHPIPPVPAPAGPAPPSPTSEDPARAQPPCRSRSAAPASLLPPPYSHDHPGARACRDHNARSPPPRGETAPAPDAEKPARPRSRCPHARRTLWRSLFSPSLVARSSSRYHPQPRPPTIGYRPASDRQSRFTVDPRVGSRPAAALPGHGQLQLWNFQVISSTFSGIQCAPYPRLLLSSRRSKPFPPLPRPNAPRSLGGSAMAPFALGSQVRTATRVRDVGLLFFPHALWLRFARSHSAQVVAAASVSVGLDSSVKGAALKVSGVLTSELASVWGISWLGLCCHCRTLFVWTVFSSYISVEK